MDRTKVDFVKGHMGGNEIILLDGCQVPSGKERQFAASALKPPNIRGHQAGFLHQGSEKNHIRARIVSVTGLDFLSMCGGLTQVLGKATEEDDFAARYSITKKEPRTNLTLLTDAGPIPLSLEFERGKVVKTQTTMNSFVRESYRLGVQETRIDGVNAYKVGEALCVEFDEIKKGFPDLDFGELGEEEFELFEDIQDEFVNQFFSQSVKEKKSKGRTFAIYDRHPERSGDIRVIFPHLVSSGHIEPSCGTGTTVVGMTMLERGQLPNNGTIRLVAESGGDIDHIGGPEKTTLNMEVKEGKLENISFTHSFVELIARGVLWL